MTYHYKYWSAFNEADLLNAGDHHLTTGDTFVMPAAATVTLASYDNDGQLSGDSNGHATDNEGSHDQFGWANTGNGWEKTGDLYVDTVYTLHGSDGKTYYLAEIEGENKAESEDFFSFVGATPPAGVTLTIGAQAESHGVNYSDLSADPSEAPANVGPVAHADTFTYQEDEAAGTYDSGNNLLANDKDADGDSLHITHVNGIAIGEGRWIHLEKGDVFVNKDGKIDFAANGDFDDLNAGETAHITFHYTISDGNGGTSSTDATIKVEGQSENAAPIFTNLPDNGVIHLDENEASVIDVAASDADGDTLTYSITGGADAAAFKINAHTGELSFINAPDFENPTDGGANNVYDVTVTVTDGNGGTDTKTLWVKIQDVDEHVNTAPVFDNLPANGVICIDENNAFVVDVNASDVDGDNLTYSITGGADAGDFSINAHTGELTFNVTPDFENPHDASGNNNVYDVTVTVTDGNGGTTTKPLWIKIKDVDENVNTAPVLSGLPDNGVICIDENGNFVVDVNASDVDGDTLTYSITGGADAANFTIDAHTGELSFINAPDFENPEDVSGNNNVYDVTVTVADGNGGFDTKSLWVKVKDVDENTGGDMECIVIEAEDMDLSGMTVVHGSQASGGELVRTSHLGGQGDLTTTFNGEGGTYDLSIFAQDETDGQSSIMVKVNGVVVEAFALDRETDGRGSNNSGFTEFVIEGVELSAGDEVMIWVDGDAGEWGRIDKIKFQQTEAEEVNPDLVCLDFEGLNAGTVVNTQFDGVMISAQRDINNTAENDAMIFDSNNPTGGDHDLATDNQNNILIISEDNDSSDPDDAIGGTIWFKFDNPSEVESIKVVDAEEGGTIRLLDENGQLIKVVTIPGGVDGGIQTVDINAEGVAQIDLTLNGSGAIDDLKFIPGDAPETGSLGGTYFMDNNDNSVEDGGDMAIAGATVFLLQNGAVIATTTTDANGDYLFDDLAAGDYAVRFDEQDGKSFVEGNVGGDDTIDSDVVSVGGAGNGNTAVVSVGAGEDVRNVDAGVEVVDTGDAQISGRITFDADDDDTENAAGGGFDEGFGGKTVELLDENGDVVATTTTNATGAYAFTGLDAGTYSVNFPDTMGLQIADQDVGAENEDSDADQNGQTAPIEVGIGDNVPNIDLSLQDPDTAAINGRLFMDNNDNNQDDAGDMGIAGVEVELLDENGDVIATTTTNGNGEYSFNGLGAGDYAVRFPEEVDGKVLVEQNVGPDATDSDADQNTGETGTISLDVGEVSNDNDAGVEDPAGSAIEGVVFMDNNDNNQNDAGDMAVAGVAVELLDEDGNVIGSTTTGADGSYSFTGLEAGTYSVNFPTEVDGKVLVNANVGNDASDSDADQGTGNTGPITVGINETSSNNDAGLETVDTGDASLAGVVFMDNNDNSQNDVRDMAISGVAVELLDVNGDVIDSTTTGADGSYEFNGLDAGSYSVRFPTTVDGKVLVDSNVGPDATDSDANTGNGETPVVELGIGERSDNNDAGFEDPGTASVAGRYFMDMNDNSRDDDEPAVVGATVWLIKAGEGIVASMTTDANGEYLFEGLEAGDYRVRFEDPADVAGQEGKVFVDANVGDDIDDSDAELDDSDVTLVGGAGNGNTVFFPVEIGDAITDVDAGIEDPGTAAIGDRVFLDENGNGQQDAGEAGVAGVDVTVFDEDGNVAGTDTTDANGDYLVDGLDAGTYTVEFEEVDGFDFTTANSGNDATDSDADQTTGVTGAVTLEIGETDLTVDAGLVAENEAPVAGDDEGMVCATEAVSINVLANDADPDGDAISIATVNGEQLATGESTTLDSGATVTLLANGELSYDSSTAVIDGVPADEIVQGETATDSFTYTVSDGINTDTGTVDVTLKGDMDTIETILESAPTSGKATFSGFSQGEAYTATISGTGDARYDGLTIAAAYCLEYDEDFQSGVEVMVDISGALDSLVNPGDFINDTSGNLDLINWLINQDFTSVDNGDGTGTNYTDAEVQAAIWGITDDSAIIFESPTNGTIANALELQALAEANGEGYVPGEGDLFTLILNPTDVQPGVGEADDFDQAFIVALPFDDFKEDCIC